VDNADPRSVMIYHGSRSEPGDILIFHPRVKPDRLTLSEYESATGPIRLRPGSDASLVKTTTSCV